MVSMVSVARCNTQVCVQLFVDDLDDHAKHVHLRDDGPLACREVLLLQGCRVSKGAAHTSASIHPAKHQNVSAASPSVSKNTAAMSFIPCM